MAAAAAMAETAAMAAAMVETATMVAVAAAPAVTKAAVGAPCTRSAKAKRGTPASCVSFCVSFRCFRFRRGRLPAGFGFLPFLFYV